jgi:hypothetical protein
VALLLRVGVHDPGHHLLVGAQVRRRDVAVGADHLDDLGRVAARDALELAGRELARVDAHAALGPAEGEAHDRALPGHPHGERRGLAERDVLVVADAALGGPHGEQVLHAVAVDGVDLVVVVAAERERHDVGALGAAQPLPDVLVEVHDPRGLVELVHREPVHGRVPLEVRRLGFHGPS